MNDPRKRGTEQEDRGEKRPRLHLEQAKAPSYKSYQEFCNFEINPGETYEEFTARYDRAYQSLKQNGDLVMSDKLLAMGLISAARLPSYLSTVNWENNENIYEDSKRVINRTCSIDDVPEELFLRIFSYLDPASVKTVRLVSRCVGVFTLTVTRL